MMMASDIAQIIYIQIYKHSVIYAHIQGIICHMIFFEDHHGVGGVGDIMRCSGRGVADGTGNRLGFANRQDATLTGVYIIFNDVK